MTTFEPASALTSIVGPIPAVSSDMSPMYCAAAPAWSCSDRSGSDGHEQIDTAVFTFSARHAFAHQHAKAEHREGEGDEGWLSRSRMTLLITEHSRVRLRSTSPGAPIEPCWRSAW